MGEFLSYTIYSGIFLLAGYLFYKLLMSAEKQNVLNRFTILGIYVFSLLARPLTQMRTTGAASGGIVFPEALEFVGINDAPAPLWPKVLVMIYIIGFAASLAWTFFIAARLTYLVVRGRHIRGDGYTLVILKDVSVAPFSWGRYVVMTEADYTSAGNLILAHELAHIGKGHCIDLLFAQAMCVVMWYNPAAWLLRDELKAIHEYQADDYVLSSGVDARNYQMLLIKKAVGTRFQSLANSLNHSKLKQRITMMYKEKSSGLRRLRGIVLGVAPLLALAVVNIPAVASALNGIGAASLNTPAESVADVSADKVNESPVEKKTESATVVKPAVYGYATFPGGEAALFAYLSENINYPEVAKEKNIEGRSVIGFTVEADGSLSNFRVLKSAGALLDQEATRVIALMPKWNPAIKNGKAIASTYMLPVSFKLTGDGKKDEAKNEAVETTDNEVKVVNAGTLKKTGQLPQNSDAATVIINGTENSDAYVVIIDGKLVSKEELNKIDPNTIESVTVKKDDPNYPDAVIYVTLKK